MNRKKIIFLILFTLGLSLLFGWLNHHFFLTLPFSFIVSWGFLTGFQPKDNTTPSE